MTQNYIIDVMIGGLLFSIPYYYSTTKYMKLLSFTSTAIIICSFLIVLNIILYAVFASEIDYLHIAYLSLFIVVATRLLLFTLNQTNCSKIKYLFDCIIICAAYIVIFHILS